MLYNWAQQAISNSDNSLVENHESELGIVVQSTSVVRKRILCRQLQEKKASHSRRDEAEVVDEERQLQGPIKALSYNNEKRVRIDKR